MYSVISFLKSGYFEDGLKAVIFLIPLVFLVLKGRGLNLRYFGLFIAGLSLLFFGNLLDFIDEFKFLHEIEFLEKYYRLQDFLEDTVGFTIGFALFMLAAYLEFIKKDAS